MLAVNKCRGSAKDGKSSFRNHQWMVIAGENCDEKQDICIMLKMSPYSQFINWKGENVIYTMGKLHHTWRK